MFFTLEFLQISSSAAKHLVLEKLLTDFLGRQSTEKHSAVERATLNFDRLFMSFTVYALRVLSCIIPNIPTRPVLGLQLALA
jgi:hypothetical protein